MNSWNRFNLSLEERVKNFKHNSEEPDENRLKNKRKLWHNFLNSTINILHGVFHLLQLSSVMWSDNYLFAWLMPNGDACWFYEDKKCIMSKVFLKKNSTTGLT